MSCEKCESDKIVLIDAKCSDMCCIQYGGMEHHGYVSSNIGIGGGDYIELAVCYDCGKVQGIENFDEEVIRSIFK